MIMRPLRRLLILLIVLLPAGLFATTFPVTKTADTDDGTCDPDCSLREAIDAANTNPGADDVPVPAGNYLLTLGQLVVTDDVDISGAEQTNTIIDGNALNRVFYISPSSVHASISDLTIQNGCLSCMCCLQDPSGAGIWNRGELALTNITVTGNENYWSRGGGIGNRGTITLTNSTVSENRGVNGGGIFNEAGEVYLINSTVSGNDATLGRGGGIFNTELFGFPGTVSITNSTVSGNYSRQGGGIFNVGILSLTNSTVSGNTATFLSGPDFYGWGGGVHNGGTASLTNSTVSDNRAFRGNGVFNLDYELIYFTNTIIADNPENCFAHPLDVFSLGHNLSDDSTCDFTEPSDLIVADALLYPLGNFGGPTKTHHPMTGSPVIDAGNIANCPATDQRGEARPFDGDDPPDGSADCDIGSVEYLPEPHHTATLIAGAAFLGLLYRRRTRGLQLG
jgi:CSLREA domain-containing protein